MSLLSVGEEGVHSGAKDFRLFEAEENGDVAAFAQEQIVAGDGDFRNDQIIEGAQEQRGFEGELGLEPFADLLSSGVANGLVEEMRSPEIADAHGLEHLGDRAETDEVKVFGNRASQAGDS